MVAWIPAAILGLLFVNIPDQFEGPLRNVPGDIGIDPLAGVDVSLVVAIVVAALLYILLLALFPEPRSAYGPEGARWFRTTDDTTVEPITERQTASPIAR